MHFRSLFVLLTLSIAANADSIIYSPPYAMLYSGSLPPTLISNPDGSTFEGDVSGADGSMGVLLAYDAFQDVTVLDAGHYTFTVTISSALNGANCETSDQCGPIYNDDVPRPFVFLSGTSDIFQLSFEQIIGTGSDPVAGVQLSEFETGNFFVAPGDYTMGASLQAAGYGLGPYELTLNAQLSLDPVPEPRLAWAVALPFVFLVRKILSAGA